MGNTSGKQENTSSVSGQTKSYCDLLESSIPAGVFTFRDSPQVRKEIDETLGKICGSVKALYRKVKQHLNNMHLFIYTFWQSINLFVTWYLCTPQIFRESLFVHGNQVYKIMFSLATLVYINEYKVNTIRLGFVFIYINQSSERKHGLQISFKLL